MKLPLCLACMIAAILLAPAATVAAEQYYVVVGSFRLQEAARGAVEEFQPRAGLALAVVPGTARGDTRYRVAAGPFDSYSGALDALAQVSVAGFSGPWIMAADIAAVEALQPEQAPLNEPDRQPESEEAAR